jgi:hypothetical protein
MGDMQLFLVRVWRRVGGFHAAVRPVASDEVRIFHRPDALTRYLEDCTQDASEGPAAAPPDATRRDTR